MATLYVENFPDDRYRALKEQARRNGRSVAAEVTELLRQAVPTEEEMVLRREVYERAIEFRNRAPVKLGPFPSTEEMVREDRER